MTRRVLYIHHCPDLGGASVSLLNLIDKLDHRRWASEVLFTCPEGDAVAAFRARRIPVHRLDGVGTYAHASGAWMPLRSVRPWAAATTALAVWPSARRVEQFLRRARFDLVHVNSAVQVPAAIGARRAGVPLVWHVREELHPGYLGLRRALLRELIAALPDRIVAISRHNADQLQPSPKVRVVYNSVDFARFDHRLPGASVRVELGVGATTPLVVMLGGAVHSKGATTFVAAAAEVRRRRPEARFLVLGYSPQPESPSPVKRYLRRGIERALGIANPDRELPRLLGALGLADAVRFLGVRTDVERVLAAADVLVFPADESHFGRPIIEAGAMAKPVVASDFAATREIVVDGETGLLVPPGDAPGFARAIARFLGDARFARAAGEAGHQLALTRYRADRHAEQITSIYEEILVPETVAGAAA